MATKLNRPVNREVDTAAARRPIIITLTPGGTVFLREKGRRVAYTVTVGWIYTQAAKIFAAAAAAEKAAAKKARKQARKFFR